MRKQRAVALGKIIIRKEKKRKEKLQEAVKLDLQIFAKCQDLSK